MSISQAQRSMYSSETDSSSWQVSRHARTLTAASPRTFGSVSRAVRSVAAGSSTAVEAGTVTLCSTRPIPRIPSRSSWGQSSPTAPPVRSYSSAGAISLA